MELMTAADEMVEDMTGATVVTTLEELVMGVVLLPPWGWASLIELTMAAELVTALAEVMVVPLPDEEAAPETVEGAAEAVKAITSR